MASTNYHNDLPDQPGLEVIQQESESGLQVVEPYSDQIEQKYKGVPQAGVTVGAIADESNIPKRRNIKMTILIALACVLVVVGVVVGAVVGTQKSPSSSPSPSPATTTSPSGQGNPEQSNGDSGPSQAEMTGSPTSVTPGLAPTAISWGYPHLEIFALTNNDTYSIYRKYRNSNATSDADFEPEGKEMELVGGGVDIGSVPSIAVNRRIEGSTNRTELHINGKGSGYRKYHDADQLWMNLDPNGWDSFQDVYVVGAPFEVQYEPSLGVMKVFYLHTGDAGLAAYYFQWHHEDGWSNAIQVPGPDLQPMTPSVIAWNGNDTRLDIFAVARANSHLLHASWDSETAKWTDYEDLRGFVTTPPVVVSRSPGILDVFARGGDAGLWHLSYDDENGSWSNWTRISGDTKIQGQPDAISATSDSLDVFAWREDGSMLHKSYDSTSKSWTPEDDFEVLENGSLSGPPKALNDGSGSIHVFAYNNQNELIWKTLGPSGQSNDAIALADVPMV
ncbi:fucose-specific lectin [Hypoxylon crocopeplum]|nr:fucose-specific lectin [Hypoxylon crocopeplum]